MERVDQLRIGPWVPESGRHADRTGPTIDDGTAEYGLHSTRADERSTMVGRSWDQLLDFAPYPDEQHDLLRPYRGYRRARRGRVLALVAALAVAAAVLLVAAGVARRGMHPVAGGAGQAPSAAPVTAVTYQADAPANTLFGVARTTPYPGASDGVIVQTLGNWGKGVGEGALRFNNVQVPATGVYALTLYYVFPNKEPTRTMIITASGFGSISMTLAGNATCCAAQVVRVDLNKGTNSITFSNPAGHAPAVDRIVIGPL
jgi:hypothetical protein